MRSSPAAFLALFVATLLAGCATPQKKLHLPPPLEITARPATEGSAADLAGTQEPRPQQLQRTAIPKPDLPSTVVADLGRGESLPAMGNEPVSVNVENMSIAAFSDVVFGQILGLNVNVDPAVSQLQEMVTLRTNEAQRPRDLYQLARQVLGEYGVGVTVEGNLVQVRVTPTGSAVTPPLIVSGRALPDVPVSHRPVFQLIELSVVRSGEASRWLATLFGGEIKVEEDALRNALLLSGKPLQVNQALEALRVFDRPLMRGRISVRLEPAFMTADQLTDKLVEVLNVQGFAASRSLGAPSSMLVIPVSNVNAVLLFASSQDVMEHAVTWARELDRPNQKAAGAQSLFYYQVKNTKAAELAQVLSGSMAITATNQQQTAAATTSSPGANTSAATSQPPATVGNAMPGLLVDEPRNALIYQGDPAQWERTLNLIRQMDRAPRQVMVEVTIAEVTLEDGEEFGIAWLFKNGFSRFNGTGTLGSMPGSSSNGNSSGSTGLTYLLDVAGQNRFALTAFANDNRVNILSVPRLLVKSGNEANIDIGTEVPTISMTTTSSQVTEGNSNLLQSIQYRKTGIILRIKPTVYSDDRIDLDISQEVSEAQPVAEGAAISSPAIFNRSLNTSLSLRDGGSVVMAGLMSQRNTVSTGGFPVLKDIPVVGNLFKNTTKRNNKTELVLMIVPYIVESDARAEEVTRAIVDRLELLELPQLPAAQPANPSSTEPAYSTPARTYPTSQP